jgi:hypothetical protein
VTGARSGQDDGGQADREAESAAGSVTFPRDEIWIDMIQFDTRTADRLCEGSAPRPGVPA